MMFTAIRQFFKPPVFENNDEKTFSARIVFSIILISYILLILALALVIALPIISHWSPNLIILGSLIVVIGLILIFASHVLLRFGFIPVASTINVLVFGTVVYGLTYLNGGIFRPVYFVNVLVLILGALTFRNRGIILTSLFLIAGAGLIFFLQTYFPPANATVPTPILNVFSVNIFILIGAAALLQFIVNILNESVARARSSERQLIEKNEQLQTFSEGLETLVSQRTTELQTASLQLERRASQFRAIAEISRSIANLQDVDSLLKTITAQISAQFNVYHVGIFLTDETKDFAILRATNSAGGQHMLARGHRLRVGAQGLVGYVTQRGRPRIALDTGIDATYFNNPDLPTTRSEATLPLIIGNNIIGALDVQSEQPSAFNENEIEILGILADQVAIAIQNARLFAQTAEALKQAQLTTSERIRSDWERFAGRSAQVGYRLTGSNVEPLRQPIQTDELQKAVTTGEVETSAEGMGIPIKLRGETIGVIGLKSRGSERQWTESDLATAQAAADRVALAVENARLIEESQRRAALERLTSDISGKISSSLRFETILRTAAEEISRALNGSEVIVQMQPEVGEDHS